MRSGPRLASLFLTVCCAKSAAAEPSLDLRNFHPPTDPHGSLFLEPAATPGPANWNVAAWFSYANRQIVIERTNGPNAALLDHQLSLDYLASIGIGERLALGLSLPTVLYQTGDDTQSFTGLPAPPRTALGDIALTAKATLLPSDELGGFGLGAIARVSAPTGNDESYLAEKSVTGELRLLAELRLIALDVRATAGAHVRGSEQTYLGSTFGNDLPWGASISLRPQVLGLDDKGRWTWTLETHGAIAATPSFASGAQSPALYGASARYAIGDVSVIAGVELPFTDAIGNPRVRAVLGIGWAPRLPDQDRDGVPDDKDECPELEEDRDGFEDSDGCPDEDNDDDGVSDDKDRCPAQKEDENGFEDDDGCPDAARAPAPKEPATESAPAEAPENPDPDGDGIENDADACPAQAGPHREDPKLDGCPNPDSDLDTLDDSEDKCPAAPEDFDGVEDDDGCPDDDSKLPPAARAKPLVTVQTQGHDRALRMRTAPTFLVQADSVSLAPSAVPVIRAVAATLNEHPSWVVLVGVRAGPATPAAEQEALSKSFAIVHALRSFTHRDEAAESVGFAAVKGAPDAQRTGIGMIVLAPTETPAPARAAE